MGIRVKPANWIDVAKRAAEIYSEKFGIDVEEYSWLDEFFLEISAASHDWALDVISKELKIDVEVLHGLSESQNQSNDKPEAE